MEFLGVVLLRWIATANVLITFILPPPLFPPLALVPQLPSTITPLSCSDSTSAPSQHLLLPPTPSFPPCWSPWKTGSNGNLSPPVPLLLIWPEKHHPVTQAETTTQMLSSTLTEPPKSCAPFFCILGTLHIFIATITSLHISFIQSLPFERF